MSYNAAHQNRSKRRLEALQLTCRRLFSFVLLVVALWESDRSVLCHNQMLG